jgi:hypothetical protein
MTKNLVENLWRGPRLLICEAQTALPNPVEDADIGIIENIGEGGWFEDQFYIVIDPAGTVNLTDAFLLALRPEPVVVADKTLTPDHTADSFTAAAHGIGTGWGPFEYTAATSFPSGIGAFDQLRGTNGYYVRALTANTLALYRTRKDAFADTNRVTFTDNGVGAQTLKDIPEASAFKTHKIVFANIRKMGDDVAGVATVQLLAGKGYQDGPFAHEPGTIGYAVMATFSVGVAITISAYPRKVIGA